MFEQRGYVGGDEVFVLAHSDDYGRAIPGGDNFVGIVDGNHDQRENSRKFLDSFADGFFQGGASPVAAFQVMIFDQVGDDFCVGFGGELVALFLEPPFQGKIIFYDAVMNDDDASAAVAVRMGVFFGGTAMSGPTGVADTECAIERLRADDFFQV